MTTTQIDFTPEEMSAFREEYFSGFTDSQFNLAIAECKRRNLVPGQHIFFQLRNAKEWDSDLGASKSIKKLTRVTTIEAFRLISQRSGEYTGMGKAKYYYLDDQRSPSIVSEIPLPHPTIDNLPREPWAASVPVYRKGFVEPVEVVCRFDAYAVTRRSGNNTVLTDMWLRRGAEQLSKCAEAASRRAAFGEELGSFYLSEELMRDDAENAPPVAAAEPVPQTEAPKPVSVPTVNHTPATPTNEPRPNEPVPEKTRTKKEVKDTTLVDVVLDKVEIVPSSQAVVQPKIDKPAPVVDVKIAVQKMDKPANERARQLIKDGVHKENFKTYSLSEAGVAETKLISQEKWGVILDKLENLFASGGKDAVNEHLVQTPAPKAEAEVDPF